VVLKLVKISIAKNPFSISLTQIVKVYTCKKIIHRSNKRLEILMNRAFLYIIAGATLWGTIGIYVKGLYSFGFTPMEVVTLRAVTAAIILLIYLCFTAPKQLKLNKWTDIKYFVGT